MNVLKLFDQEKAKEVGRFLTSRNAFDHEWFPGEKTMVREAVQESLKSKKHQYWYSIENNVITGAIGVRENKCKNGGFEMDADYVAVHNDYRRKGIASSLLKQMEKYVKENSGRYIHILTCDIDSYAPARTFYEKRGYKKVAEIPNYYSNGEGRIDYFKQI